MANQLTPENKRLLELVIDGLATFILGYLVWTLLFNQPPVEAIHGMISVLGTGALSWLAWKQLRKSQAL